MAIRIVLADDHPIVLEALRLLFMRHTDFDVVACCADARSAKDAVHAHVPDLALIDLRMPGVEGDEYGGLTLLSDLAREGPGCRVVVLTAAISDEHTADVVRYGASGLILKDASPDQLVMCARRVHAGERWFDPEAGPHASGDGVDAGPRRGDMARALTSREIEIIRMVGRGMRNRAIGVSLGISESTVKVHLYNIYQKVGVEGRVGLVLFAQEKGLV